MKMKVSDYIAQFIVEKNIEHVFTVTGGGAMHLNDSFAHHKQLECIYNHHEQACAIAAEAYARLSGKLACVCVTSGPGGTNALTGVLGGWLDSIPMFIVSGQVKTTTTVWSTDLPLRQLGDQEFNITDCVKPMTKYAKMITDSKQIAYELEKAYYLAINGRPGPVWLDVPLDIQGAIIETEDLKHYDCKEDTNQIPPSISNETIEEVLKWIKNAKRPVILAGSAIRLSGAHDKFIQLIEKLNIPVVTAWNAHDNIWDNHPLYCGRPGTIGNRGGNFVVQNSDLLISLGCRLNIRQISYNWENFAKNAKKVIIDIDEAELRKPTIKPNLPIHGNVKELIEKLLQTEYYYEGTSHVEWLKWCKEINRAYPIDLPKFYENVSILNPYAFLKQLFDRLSEGDTIITSNGSACVCTFQAAYLKRGQRLFTNSGCASMGYGLPAAIGAAVSLGKGEKIICIEGDGSLQMNIQELQTVVQNKMNIAIIVLNNSGYHSIRQTQTNLFNPPMYGVDQKSGISFPELEKIAYAYGLPYVKSDSLMNLSEEITEVITHKGPIIYEVIVDPNQFFEPKLSAKILPDGKMISPPLDDMYPFIPKEEYEKISAIGR